MKQGKPSGIDTEQEAVRSALLSIAERSDGRLNPRHVVEEARSKESILHSYFEWDDTIAGEHYRVAQASGLIRRLKITVLREEQEKHSISLTAERAFQSRPSQRGANGGYESIESLIKDPTKYEELLVHVGKELLAYRKRYRGLSELRAVWAAIDDVIGEPASPAKGTEAEEEAPL